MFNEFLYAEKPVVGSFYQFYYDDEGYQCDDYQFDFTDMDSFFAGLNKLYPDKHIDFVHTYHDASDNLVICVDVDKLGIDPIETMLGTSYLADIGYCTFYEIDDDDDETEDDG